MNTLIIVKMTKVTYDNWKIKFDEDAEVQSKMMRNTTVGKVDDNTAMVLTEVFNPEMVQEFMNSDDFTEMETNLGLSHEVYKVEKINSTWFDISYLIILETFLKIHKRTR